MRTHFLPLLGVQGSGRRRGDFGRRGAPPAPASTRPSNWARRVDSYRTRPKWRPDEGAGVPTCGGVRRSTPAVYRDVRPTSLASVRLALELGKEPCGARHPLQTARPPFYISSTLSRKRLRYAISWTARGFHTPALFHLPPMLEEHHAGGRSQPCRAAPSSVLPLSPDGRRYASGPAFGLIHRVEDL